MRTLLFVCCLFLLLLSCRSERTQAVTSVPEAEGEELDSLPEAVAVEEDIVVETINPGIFVPEQADYDTTKWTDVLLLDSTIYLDIRYATDSNFVEEKMYDCARCFLRPRVAKAVVGIHQTLKQQGYGGLKMFDCYRPRPIQQKLWDKVPDPRYVADPGKGSQHNRGGAVDLTIVYADGSELEMGTGFDYFGKEAYHNYAGFPDSILQNRQLLRSTMEANKFKPITTEWWHYSFAPQAYPISDMLWNCE